MFLFEKAPLFFIVVYTFECEMAKMSRWHFQNLQTTICRCIWHSKQQISLKSLNLKRARFALKDGSAQKQIKNQDNVLLHRSEWGRAEHQLAVRNFAKEYRVSCFRLCTCLDPPLITLCSCPENDLAKIFE